MILLPDPTGEIKPNASPKWTWLNSNVDQNINNPNNSVQTISINKPILKGYTLHSNQLNSHVVGDRASGRGHQWWSGPWDNDDVEELSAQVPNVHNRRLKRQGEAFGQLGIHTVPKRKVEKGMSQGGINWWSGAKRKQQRTTMENCKSESWDLPNERVASPNRTLG